MGIIDSIRNKFGGEAKERLKNLEAIEKNGNLSTRAKAELEQLRSRFRRS